MAFSSPEKPDMPPPLTDDQAASRPSDSTAATGRGAIGRSAWGHAGGRPTDDVVNPGVPGPGPQPRPTVTLPSAADFTGGATAGGPTASGPTAGSPITARGRTTDDVVTPPQPDIGSLPGVPPAFEGRSDPGPDFRDNDDDIDGRWGSARWGESPFGDATGFRSTEPVADTLGKRMGDVDLDRPGEPTGATVEVPTVTSKTTLYPPTIEAGKPKRKQRGVVIRDKRQVLLQTSILIEALEEAHGYDITRQHNQEPPALWRDLNLDDAAARVEIAELIVQLKELNAHLTALRANRVPVNKDMERVKKSLFKFADRYMSVVASGAGALTVGAACVLLSEMGRGDVVAAALAWRVSGFGKK